MTGAGDDRAGGLAVRGLRVIRSGRVVLRDVSFDAPKGCVTVVVAPSGAGKSTLLRCLNGLLEPQAGAVLLDGEDVAALDPCTLRRRVGLMGQGAVMLPGSVRENLLYALGVVEEPRLVRALADAGLDASFLERPARALSGGERARVALARALSGGERARVALARALTRDPEMLVLDEPTAALDAEAAGRIARTLAALAQDGLGVVLATHDLAFGAAVAHRAVALRDGVAQTGPPATLLAAQAGAP